MFPPPEPDQRRETPAAAARRRARDGLDRRGLKHVAVAMVLLFGGMALLFATDVVGVERRITTATVVRLIDRWSMKRDHQCVTQLKTVYGEAEIFTRDFCRNAAWRIGDRAQVEARRTRLSRILVVSTRGTIFSGAYSFLPES